jgi:tRNA A37 threonylcarbamoyladenosine dehydratase
MECQRRNGALYERTAILVKDHGIVRLQAANVLLVGVGGVGGHCAEALVRAGIGSITLCDHDVVSATNKNRQLIALDSTIGKSKVEQLAKRLSDINAQCVVTALDAFVMPEDIVALLQREAYTHVVDCIDSVECKIALLEASVKLGIPTFSSGGAGGRLDPTQVREGDLFETENDALARACRSELRRRGVTWGYIRMVYSVEKALPPLEPVKQESGGRDRGINGTVSYMPPLFGLHLAAMVIRHAIDDKAEDKAAAGRKKRAAHARSDEERLKRDAAAKERRPQDASRLPVTT